MPQQLAILIIIILTLYFDAYLADAYLAFFSLLAFTLSAQIICCNMVQFIKDCKEHCGFFVKVYQVLY